MNDHRLLKYWYAELNACQLPHFGQAITWVLLGACFILGCLPFEVVTGERQGPATVFAWMPHVWLVHPTTYWFFRALLWTGAILWLLQRGLPWSCWLTTLGFTGLWSLHMETTTNGAHIFNATNQLLIVQSLWVTSLSTEIKRAWETKTFWKTALYPNWVFWLGLATLGWFHTSAGVAKFMHSGWEWPNGISLQLWAYWDGRPGSWTRELIINNRDLAFILQWMTLIFEAAGILVLFNRPLRWLIGLALVGFYIGVVMTFDYGFHINLLLTALYHFPFDYWLPQWFSAKHAQLSQNQMNQTSCYASTQLTTK